jgi:hypothetical protein
LAAAGKHLLHQPREMTASNPLSGSCGFCVLRSPDR